MTDDEAVCGTAWSADGQRVAVLTEGGTVAVWDVGNGRKVRSFALGGGTADTAAFSPDGRRLAVDAQRNWDGPGTVAVYDIETGERLLNLTDLIHDAHATAFSPDGRRLVTADMAGKFVKVWDVATGWELLTLPGLEWLETLAFTPDGQRLVAAGPGGVRVFNAAPLRDE